MGKLEKVFLALPKPEKMNAVKTHKKKWNKKRKFPSRASQRIFTKNFSDENVDRLRRILENQNQRGDEKFFAIKIDGEFCIYRTSNTKMFNDYKEFIDASTESVEVILYFGKSNNCNRHIFYLKENQAKGIHGHVSVEEKIKEALDQKDRDYLIASLKEKVKDQKGQIKELQEELEELKGKTDLRGIIKDGISLIGAFRPSEAKTDTGLSGKEAEDDAEVTVEADDEDSNEPPKKEKQQEAQAVNPSEDALEAQFTYEENRIEFEAMKHELGDKGVEWVLGLFEAIGKSPEFKAKINKVIAEENQRITNLQNEEQ